MVFRRFFPLILGLISIGFMVSSCMEMNMKNTGFFKFHNMTSGRSIASLNFEPSPQTKKIEKNHNPIQFYLHCTLRSENTAKKCYYEKLEKALLTLNLSKEDPNFQKLEQYYSFEKAKVSVQRNFDKANRSIASNMINIVHNRASFCKINSTHFMKRCLLQYSKPDSIKLVNHLQSNHPEINGLEYLYLKEKVEQLMEEKLLEQYTILKTTL